MIEMEEKVVSVGLYFMIAIAAGYIAILVYGMSLL